MPSSIEPPNNPNADTSLTQNPEYQNEGIRNLLALLARGEPEARLSLRQMVDSLHESAFGIVLLAVILPSFVPIPGGGMISGPLVVGMGIQMLCGMGQPWLPHFIAGWGFKYHNLQQFFSKMERPLRWLDRALTPRLSVLLDPLLARMFTGLLLICSGILLSLPIPFTNFLFAFQLLLFALALMERDGLLMLINWLGAIATTAFFGIGSQQLLVRMWSQIQSWMSA